MSTSVGLMLPPAPRRPSIGQKVGTPAHIAVGARIEAAWQGSYYGAQVTALAGQSAHVLFDDGVESTVGVSEIRAARLPEGTSVELRLSEQDWLPGKVVRARRDGSYDVELQSGEVHKSRLPVNVREALGPSAPASPDAISPPASPEEASSQAVSPAPARAHAFAIGDTVEANCRGLGQYYMGVVTAVLDDGSFRISYTDGDCESGVPERYMRRIQTRRRPSKATQPANVPSARSPLKSIHNKRKSGTNLDTDRAAKKKHVADSAAAAAAPDLSAVIYCDSGYPLALQQQLQIWDGQGDVLPQNEVPRGRSSMEFHDVYGSTLSPKRQNEALGQRSVSGSVSLNVPGVVSETPYYYRKQKQQQMQQQRYSKQQPGCVGSSLGPAEACYIKGGKSAAQIEWEVDYELDLEDEKWLESLNRAGKEQCAKDWGIFLEEDMEVLIDRYEKADATLHKLAGHSAVRTEVLLHERPAVPDVRGVSTVVQQQVHEWWMEKRNSRGEQLLRRFRAPPDDDDEDDTKAFRRASIGPRMSSPLQCTAGSGASPARDGVEHQVGDMVEANYHGRGQYFGGIIAAVNPNGSFAVKYHDGDSENEVPSVFIRKMTSRRRSSSAQLPSKTASAHGGGTLAAPTGSGASAAASVAAHSSTAGGAAVDQQKAPLYDGKGDNVASAGGSERAYQSQSQSQSQLPPSPKSAGDIIEANYHGRGKFYTGIVSAVNPNGTYRVQYHDGDCEDEVPAFDVRRLANRRRRNPQPSSAAVTPTAASTPRPNNQEDTAVPGLSTHCNHSEESAKKLKKTAKESAPSKPTLPAKGQMPANVKKETTHPKPKTKAHRKSADPLLISKEQAFSLRSGDRVLFQWDEPEDKDHGVWFASTVTSDGTKSGWFELEFDTFSVSNTSSWNLPYIASKGRLRRAATTAASRIRRGAGPVLEWSRSMGGSVLPADQVTPRRGAAKATAAAAARTQSDDADSESSPSEVERRRQEAAESELEALKAGPPPSPKAVGDIVEANYRGRGQWYSGIVAAADTGGAGYTIQYHDGDSEENVPAWYVKRMAARSRARPRQPEAAAVPTATRMPRHSTGATTSDTAETQPSAAASEPAAKRARTDLTQTQQAQDVSSDGSLWQTLWSELVKVGWHQTINPFRQRRPQQQPTGAAASASEHDMLYFAPTSTACAGDSKTKAAVLDSKAAVFRFLANASRTITSGSA